MQTTNEMIHRLRDEKPRCPICDKQCDPDVQTITVLAFPVPHPTEFDLVALLPVHSGACEAEARDRAVAGQAAVAN